MAGALNARTEVLAAVAARTPAECSTFVVAPPAGGGPPRTIQTWDWYDSTSSAAERTAPRASDSASGFSSNGPAAASSPPTVYRVADALYEARGRRALALVLAGDPVAVTVEAVGVRCP